MVKLWVPRLPAIASTLGMLVFWVIFGRFRRFQSTLISAVASFAFVFAVHSQAGAIWTYLTGEGTYHDAFILDTEIWNYGSPTTGFELSVAYQALGAALAVYFGDRMAQGPSMLAQRLMCMTSCTPFVDLFLHLASGMLLGSVFGSLCLTYAHPIS